MFEQEAKLRSKEWFSNNVDTSTYETPFTERYCYELGFKDGAELGYNKANEWHFIEDSELPKDESRVWLYFGDDDYNDGIFTSGRFWCGSCGWFDVADVIAWQELVPPKKLKDAEVNE